MTVTSEKTDNVSGPAVLENNKDNLLRFSHVNLSRNGRSVLDNVSFELARGETLGLVGESGAGKSTIALATIGLLQGGGIAVDGEICFGDYDNLLKMQEPQWAKLRGREIAMIFQDAASALNPSYTVGQQLGDPLRRLLSMTRAQTRRQSIELLESVGLNDAEIRLKAFPHELSGGMQQRVMIAIALACSPVLLLADEPTSALDVTIQAQIMQLILDQTRMRNASCIFVLHDLALASQTCDSIVVLYAGQVVEKGCVDVVLRQPLHPYTQALKSCVIELDTVDLSPPPGGQPSLDEVPTGCRFAPRCSRATAKCVTSVPEIKFTQGRHLACWHPG